MMKLSCLGAEGLGREGKAASTRQSPCGPTAGWRSSLRRGWVSAGSSNFSKSQLGSSEIAVSPKHNSPHRATNQTAYGCSTKSDPLSLESWLHCQSMVRQAALWNESVEGFVLFFLGCI